ncbi:hypothetical protein [Flavobacterium davisii]|uniref:hypothetical protein n=1 Tax=Flavobacterium davisii TaxID=2906077 RepID=UPI0035D04652
MTNKYKIVISFLLLVIFAALIFVFSFKEEKVYTSHEYNSNGQLIGINEYIIRNSDTILQGKFERYNDKGILISKGQFLNDEVYGKCLYYYHNGKVKSIYFRKNSKINLECFYYNQNGLLEKYIMCDDIGNTAFIIYFDEKGATKYNGYFQIETYQYKFSHPEQFKIKEQQYLKVGDKLKYSYLIANIPNAKRSIKIENISVDNSKVKRTLKHIEPCQWDVEEVLTKKGKNTIQSIVKYEFKDKVTPVFIDTLSFDIEVH